jgi:MFS family permease
MSDHTSPNPAPVGSSTANPTNTATYVILLSIMALGGAWTFDMPMALSNP